MPVRPRIVIVVKYFLPLRRISGVLNYLAALTPRLAEHADVHVVTWRPRDDDQSRLDLGGYVVHRVTSPFPWNAGAVVAGLRPDATLVVSGIYDIPKAALYFATFRLRAAKRGGRQVLYQATHMNAQSRHLLDRLLHLYDDVISADETTAQELSKRRGRTVSVVPPGIDLRALQSITPDPRTSRYRIGFVNHLNHVKGADLALDAFEHVARRVPDADFVIAGDGELGPPLRARYGSHEAFGFQGYVDDAARLRLMASCDVVVFPFRTAVSVLGVSQTVLECMALGAIVVGSRSAAITPAVSNGIDGLLYDDPRDIEHLVVDLLGDEPRRQRIRATAIERVAAYDVQRRAERLLELLT